MRARKKGKLPQESIAVMKAWWSAHITWPYQDEADKGGLQKETGLTLTQINNWFINQRKRHWHKLFKDGPPDTEEAARRALMKQYGSLAKAIDAMEQA